MARLALPAVMTCLAALSSAPAAAQIADCAARDTVIDYLAQEYAEHPVARGFRQQPGGWLDSEGVERRRRFDL